MSLQMPIRLIATDMDGTLLTDEPLILPETADVLRRAAEKGIVLSLASGRLPDDASFFAVDAKLPMHVIALNGAVTLVKPLGDVQEAHHLPQPTVHRITARLDEANRAVRGVRRARGGCVGRHAAFPRAGGHRHIPEPRGRAHRFP